MERKQIRADLPLGNYDHWTGTVAEFKAMVDGLAATLGADEDAANVFFDTDTDYDGGTSITAYVWRWETDDEAEKREAQEAEAAQRQREYYAARAEARELATLAALLSKYGVRS